MTRGRRDTAVESKGNERTIKQGLHNYGAPLIADDAAS
jgi:hypothetical protein